MTRVGSQHHRKKKMFMQVKLSSILTCKPDWHLHTVIISEVVLIQLSSWGWKQRCSKHVEGWNEHIIEEIVRQVGHLPELNSVLTQKSNNLLLVHWYMLLNTVIMSKEIVNCGLWRHNDALGNKLLMLVDK